MTSRFSFGETKLAGLFVAQRKPIEDSRGFFARFFCAEEFRELGLTKPIVQINHTLTHKKGAVRGMHFQYPPHAETKIVSCLKGKIFDVAIDIRHGSPTFLQWHGVELSAENLKSLYIPEGFAHGFQTLTEDCELLYLHTAPYVPEAEGALHVNDPRLNIKWPLPIAEISERDNAHSFIGKDFEGVRL
ncbi:MAG: dTDP-4-dehydrorhamnose 3,5-epimerase [Desulfomonilaceae bacterium]